MKERPGLLMSGPAEFVAGQPALGKIAEAAGEARLYLVGGAVRDALLGIESIDLDVVIEGQAIELAEHLDEEATTHERFGTAEIEIEGTKVDLVTARSERYSHPGSLPEVTPASLTEDLGRRDFTINAMAVALSDPGAVIDPRGGLVDLERGVLRVLHPDSFRDDPTRALRAARYAARFGFDLEPATSDLLSTVDLGSISSERVSAELDLIASEETGLKALGLIGRWGLMEIDPERVELAAEAIKLSQAPPWLGASDRREIVMEAVLGELDRLAELGGSEPVADSEAVMRARKFSATDQLLARADGSQWLDHYRSDLAGVELEISGDDLIRAGVTQGPAVGKGLDAALVARLDNGVLGSSEQLAVALIAARA